MKLSVTVISTRSDRLVAAKAAGLQPDAVRRFADTGIPHAVEYEVDPETGAAEAVAIDGRKVGGEEKSVQELRGMLWRANEQIAELEEAITAERHEHEQQGQGHRKLIREQAERIGRLQREARVREKAIDKAAEQQVRVDPGYAGELIRAAVDIVKRTDLDTGETHPLYKAAVRFLQLHLTPEVRVEGDEC